MEKDNGSWLSAQQAVMPDGTELQGLNLIHRKLPPFAQTGIGPDESTANSSATYTGDEPVHPCLDRDPR